jgi:hypothetical protein
MGTSRRQVVAGLGLLAVLGAAYLFLYEPPYGGTL